MVLRLIAVSVCLFPAMSADSLPADRIFRKGTELFGRRDLPAARQEFLRLIKVPSFSRQSQYYLGRISLLEAKPEDAIRWLEPLALTAAPVPDAAAQLGKAYLDAGQPGKAKSVTELAVRAAQWDGALHYRLARIYQQLGKPDDAQREFAESVRLKTADRESVELLVQCSEKLTAGQPADAMRIGQELIDNPSLDPDALVALGLIFTGAGLQAESVSPFQTAARRDPAFFQAQYNAGLALLKLGRAAEAVPYLEAARRLSPDLPDSNSALALAYVLQTRYGDALSPLEKWSVLQPVNPRALNMLGMAYLRTHAAARAIPVLRRAVHAAQGDPKPYFLLIEALNATEQQQAALVVADNALKLFPALPEVNLAKAQQLSRLGQYRDAGPLFARAAELAPGSIESLLGLAEVQQKQGDYAGSLGVYQRVLAIDAANTAASLGAARNLIATKDLVAARSVLESSVAAHPDHSPSHYELARVYAQLGEKSLAAEQTQILQRLRAHESETP
jgi:tetratricopeptide (TPR) repeat protein